MQESSSLLSGPAGHHTTAEAVVLVLIVLQFFTDAIYVFEIASFLPDWVEDRGLNQTWIGAFLGLHSAGTLCGSVAAVRLVMKFKSQALVISSFLISVCIMLMALVPPHLEGVPLGIAIISIRTVSGLGSGFLQVSGISLVLRTVPEKDVAIYTGGVEACRALAALLGPVMGGWMFESYGYRAAFLAPACSSCIWTLALGVMVMGLGEDMSFSHIENKVVPSWDLVTKPPTIALLYVFFLTLLPAAFTEASIEPYLTAAPFHLSPGQVATAFAFWAAMDIFGFLITGPLLRFVHPLLLLFILPMTLCASLVFLVVGPATLPAVIGAFGGTSLSCTPIFVVSSQILLLVCRTYGLDPRAHSEVISSTLAVTFTLSIAIGGLASGWLCTNFGFKWLWAGGAIAIATGPIVAFWGFNPAVMGRPLAPPANEVLPPSNQKLAPILKKQAQVPRKSARSWVRRLLEGICCGGNDQLDLEDSAARRAPAKSSLGFRSTVW